MVVLEVKSEEQAAEKLVSSILEKEQEPISTFEVFNKANNTDKRIDRGSVQRAIWNLIDSGKVFVTSDRRLSAKRNR